MTIIKAISKKHSVTITLNREKLDRIPLKSGMGQVSLLSPPLFHSVLELLAGTMAPMIEIKGNIEKAKANVPYL